MAGSGAICQVLLLGHLAVALLHEYESALRASADLLHNGVTHAPDPVALREAANVLEQLPPLDAADRRLRQLSAAALPPASPVSSASG